MLELKDIELLRSGRTIARIESLHVDRPGLLCLVGPGGAGKSSLLHALAGRAEAPDLTIKGRVTLNGLPLDPKTMRTVWVSQRQHLDGDDSVIAALCADHGLDGQAALDLLRSVGMAPRAEDPLQQFGDAERRFLAVLAGLSQPAQLYLIDEPTFGLNDVQTGIVRERIHALSGRAIVLVVTHNRQDCLSVGGMTALLAGGEIQELAPSSHFFAQPHTDAGRVYVATGNCSIATKQVEPVRNDGIWWLVPGLMCGMSRPGLVADATTQYQSLAERGVRKLLCLEERCSYPPAPLRELGISRHHFAIPDMAPPGFAQAVDICRLVEHPIRANEGIAVHCRGGLGRTGTVLAAILIWFGDSADTAITKVRNVQPLAIQTAVQLRFLHDFADRVRGWHDPQYPLGGETHVA